jgi:hypothetical protein
MAPVQEAEPRAPRNGRERSSPTNVKEEGAMTSLMQAQAVQQLEKNGWSIVEPTGTGNKGGAVMMSRTVDGEVRHTFVMPDGTRPADAPTAAEIREW